mgnify:CR=1 FL=1
MLAPTRVDALHHLSVMHHEAGENERALALVDEAGAVDGIGGVRVSDVIESDAPFRQEYNPGHAMADDKGYVQMPNVNPTDEMINMISSSRSYQANIEVLNTGKELALRTLTLGE